MLSICSSDPGYILNSRLIILCYESRWLSQRHFKPNSALPLKPAFLHQPHSSSSSGPKPWRGTWFPPLSHHVQSICKAYGLQLQGEVRPLPFAAAHGPVLQHLLSWWQGLRKRSPAPTCVVGTALISTYSLIFLLLFCGVQNCSGRERIFVLPLWHGSEILTCLADLQLEHWMCLIFFF